MKVSFWRRVEGRPDDKLFTGTVQSWLQVPTGQTNGYKVVAVIAGEDGWFYEAEMGSMQVLPDQLSGGE